jgi:GTP-binding protein of the ras superfamily involved in termination of M-phase
MEKCRFDSNKGVNFMEKTISIRGTEITFSIWDLGGTRIFVF